VDEYSALDRFLHRLALESVTVSELLFDLESSLFRNAAPPRDAVYVTGLARCGSTFLLRSLYSSGAFACLTYRDMPFVIAPNLWARMAGFLSVKPAARERPHGDGIVEDLGSPEGLEEVFWRKELGNVYIQKEGLSVHDVPADTVERLKRYQSLVCARYGSPRYLAKNNNLMLRIRSLAPLTPECCFLVLFRHPLAHAESLLRQHRRFSTTSGFTQEYMRWLVHHEFGADHRPFQFPGIKRSIRSPNAVDYWLERWIDAHSFLLDVFRQKLGNIVPVQYERLCDDKDYRSAIFRRIGVSLVDPGFKNRNRIVERPSISLVERAMSLYSELCLLAIGES
jgi:hypothetical protein